MEFTAQQISDYLQGKVEGNPHVRVSGFSKIEEGKSGTLSFLSNPKYNKYIYESNADIVLVNSSFAPEHPVKATLIKVENAYEAIAKLLTLAEQYSVRKTGISDKAYIAETAKVGSEAYIEAFVSINDKSVLGDNVTVYSGSFIGDNVIIGDNVTIYAGVKIYKGCIVGNNCILHAGAVIGSDGFGFAPATDGVYSKIPQTGNVVIEDNVEIGANTTIDRATLGSTVIRKGVKIDNLVQVAHNVEIGENTVIAAQTGISGSAKIGKSCMIAGQVGFAGHITIADNTIVAAQTGVPNSVKTPGQILMGYPAIPLRDFQHSAIVFKNLPEMQKLIYDLKRQFDVLQNTNRNDDNK